MPAKPKQLNINFTIQDTRHIYSISELSRNIRKILEDNFPALWVEGEVSNLSEPASGHVYLTLKDENAQVKAVIFKGFNAKLKFKLEDGMKLVCFGKISVYERGGQYQLQIEKAEPKGIGALQIAFNQLKEKLYKEGLFEEKHKKPIPLLPERVGIVTSPTGAAIRDILNILNRRFTNLEVYLMPVAVQGEKAAASIAQAIDDFNALGSIDVMIVGRGGGSLEDLWAFNEEIVARAIFKSRIPVISAVGHEIDYTISDFVADLRAPTPSAAAELVIAKKEELTNRITDLAKDIETLLSNKLIFLKQKLIALTGSYALKQPQDLVAQFLQRIDDLSHRLQQGLEHLVKSNCKEISLCTGRLNALSPLAVLSRGYSITLCNGKSIKDAQILKPGQDLITRLHRGEVESTVKKIKG